MHVEYIKREDESSNIKRSQAKESRSPAIKGKRKLMLNLSFWKYPLIIAIIVVTVTVVSVPTIISVMNKRRNKTGAVVGNWGNWTSISDCSHTCGGGTMYRIRRCDNPRPSRGGTWCLGNNTDTHSCSTHTCPVDGGWGKWTSFTHCSKSCGGGIKARQRECNSPFPDNGGKYCYGDKNETESCNTQVCPVNGEWGNWVVVSGCSSAGKRYRVRSCDSPSPNTFGEWCDGDSSEFQRCDTDYRSAFTAMKPTETPTLDSLTFGIVQNNGIQFNASTGLYVCDYPGIYVFSLHIYLKSGYDLAHCYIRKNRSNIVQAYLDPNGSGYYEASNTVVLQLRLGDTIDLGGCTSASTMWYWTSFTGFLLKAD